jgi:hypothetical protein
MYDAKCRCDLCKEFQRNRIALQRAGKRKSVRSRKPAKPKPVAAKPVAAKPVAAKPVAAKPVATKQVATKPVAVKPVAAKPTLTDVARMLVGSYPSPQMPINQTIIHGPTVKPEPIQQTTLPIVHMRISKNGMCEVYFNNENACTRIATYTSNGWQLFFNGRPVCNAHYDTLCEYYQPVELTSESRVYPKRTAFRRPIFPEQEPPQESGYF